MRYILRALLVLTTVHSDTGIGQLPMQSRTQMKKSYLWLILLASILSIAAHADTYTLSFTGTGTVPFGGSFQSDGTSFTSLQVEWFSIPTTPPTTPPTYLTFDLTSAANAPTGTGCGSATTSAAMAFALLTKSLTPSFGCSGGMYQWNAVAYGTEGTQRFEFSYGPVGSTISDIAINVTAYYSKIPPSVGNSGTWTTLPVPTAPEPSTLGLLSTGLLTGIGILRRKVTL